MEVGSSRKGSSKEGLWGWQRAISATHTKELLIPYTLLSENQYFLIKEFLSSLIVLISPKASFHTPMGEPTGLVLVVFLLDTRCRCWRQVPGQRQCTPHAEKTPCSKAACPGCSGSCREDAHAPSALSQSRVLQSLLPTCLLQALDLLPGLQPVPRGWDPESLVPFL